MLNFKISLLNEMQIMNVVIINNVFKRIEDYLSIDLVFQYYLFDFFNLYVKHNIRGILLKY